MKGHQIAQLVNQLRDIAVKYHAAGQLREHISQAVNDALPAAAARWRHRKSQGLYEVLGTATLQADAPLGDMESVVVYRGQDGRLWVRGEIEFAGRFDAEPTQPEIGGAACCSPS
jgi:hypothetical protein